MIWEHFSHRLECLSPTWSLWDCLTVIWSSNPHHPFAWDIPCHQISFYHLHLVDASRFSVTQPCYPLGSRPFHYESKHLIQIRCSNFNLTNLNVATSRPVFNVIGRSNPWPNVPVKPSIFNLNLTTTRLMWCFFKRPNFRSCIPTEFSLFNLKIGISFLSWILKSKTSPFYLLPLEHTLY